jgi:hypothetical protein
MLSHGWHHHADIRGLIAVIAVLLAIRLLMALARPVLTIAIVLVAGAAILALVRGQDVPRIADARRHLSGLAEEAAAEAADVVGPISDPALAPQGRTDGHAPRGGGARITAEPAPWRQ